METVVSADLRLVEPAVAPAADPVVRNPYGRFREDGREYIITNPRTPRPWVNIIANPRLGLAVSQTGSGFTWIDNSQLAVITRWQQDLNQDASGKFLYARDAETGVVWSLSPAPVWAADATYRCHHGIGYTTFVCERDGIRSAWTLFVDEARTVECWLVTLENVSGRARRIELTAYAEWNCGVAPSPRREFHKLFLETTYDPSRRSVIARNHMWEVSNARWGHWNTPFPYVSALACTEPVVRAEGDKAAFLGRYGELRAPAALAQTDWAGRFGRHQDPIAAITSEIELPPGTRHELGYALAVGMDEAGARVLLDEALHVSVLRASLERVQAAWARRLSAHRIETPVGTLNYVINDWVRYQAISGRLWGRAGYYQQSGAFGFRDQLQDSQVWLTIEPQRCREQIRLHAEHQFADGSVYHWWHPLTEQGHVTRMTDDLLWLAFVTANYIKETGDYTVLEERAAFLDEARPVAIIEHVERAFSRVFSRMSPRGLPYIGAGDWNDGLSACGLLEHGESIWLGHFLAGLLADWAEVYRRREQGTRKREQGAGSREQGAGKREDGAGSRDQGLRRREGADSHWAGPAPGRAALAWLERAAELEQSRAALVAAINEHGWDGGWYWRATLDDGSKIGSRENRVGRIFLNAQTWAILNDVAPAERRAAAWAAVVEHLVTEAGALLLAPAYDLPDERIGYITRYAPGLRENGGVYTHAATWAIAAACRMRDAETVGRLLTAINPALKDAEQYWAEPYVLPGNVDGPVSPYFGRGGWTWYTGSAQWLHRVVTQWVLGVRPEWDGLVVDPCLPPSWSAARMTRPWRGCTYEVEMVRVAGRAGVRVSLDGRRLTGNVLPPPDHTGAQHHVRVEIS